MTRTSQLFLCVGIAAWAGGCPRDSLRPQVSEPPRVSNMDPRGMAGAVAPAELPASTRALATDFAEAICAAREACVGPSTLRELEPDERCAERVAAELRARELYHLASAIDAGHVLYDPSGLPACLAELRALACDVVAVRFPGPCANVLVPNVGPGGECLIDAECEGAAICEGDAERTCPTTCRPRAAQGVACRGSAQCQDGLTCADGVCQRPPQQGMACGGASGVECAFGFVCVGGDAARSGACARLRALRVAAEGDACDAQGERCEDGLSCVAQGGSMRCAKSAALDGPCRPGAPDPCPSGAYCEFDAAADAGVCRELPGAGEPCAVDARCGAGFVCLGDATAGALRTLSGKRRRLYGRRGLPKRSVRRRRLPSAADLRLRD